MEKSQLSQNEGETQYSSQTVSLGRDSVLNLKGKVIKELATHYISSLHQISLFNLTSERCGGCLTMLLLTNTSEETNRQLSLISQQKKHQLQYMTQTCKSCTSGQNYLPLS